MHFIVFLSALFAIISLCSSNERPSSCAEVLLEGNTQSGIYTIYPKSWYNHIPFQVYCDMETEGGGWTVFQRRDDYEIRENFYRGWNDYKHGFGKLDKDFWLGNERLYVLTNQDHVTLRVDLKDFEGNQRKAEYDRFQINDRRQNYKLEISGYHGDAGDSLSGHNAAIFSTHDRNDVNACSKTYKGAWWYTKCHVSNLNGMYLKGNHTTFADGVNWKEWLGYHYSLKKTEMKIRPTNFLPDSYLPDE